MIGCTILRAVSGILRTHRGRRGSGLGRQLAVATCAGLVRRYRAGYPLPLVFAASPSPLWLNSSPVWLNSSLLAPVAQLFARAARLLSPGRRRAVLTSHWPWVSSRAARRRAGSQARIATAVYVGVQWGEPGLARLRVDRRQRRLPSLTWPASGSAH